MPSGSPIALILGAGANVGQSVSRAFAAKGYKIALAARSLKEEDSTPDQLHIRGDFTDPESVANVFAKVKAKFGLPHVVIYNASSSAFTDAKSPLGLTLKDFSRDFAINTASAFVAAQQAITAFEELPGSASRTFIFTGNCTNDIPILALMDSGVGKSASAHIIQCAAEAYKEKGFKFYYADERNLDGSPAYGKINGPAHGEFYTALAEGTSQGPWQQTFVKGVGYKNFKYISELEERLKKMEALLQNATAQKPPGEGEPSQKTYTPYGILAIEERESLQTDGGETHKEMAYQSLPGLHVESSSSGFLASLSSSHSPLFRSHENFYEILPSPVHQQQTGARSLVLGPFSVPSFHELPAKSVALDLVGDAFRSFNRFFPLFNEQDFLRQFEHQYANSSPENAGWWACVNVVLALAHRFRAMRTLETAWENSQSCGYLCNALAVVSELNMLHRSLPAVQALVGMATILQGTPNPQSSSVLTAAAVRLSQTMGLHRRTQDVSLSKTEVEQRKRVFWIAYFLDKDISLRMQQPYAQDDDDMDVEIPTGHTHELKICGDIPCDINFFNARIGLAVIQGQTYKRLYSVQASRQSEAQKAAVAQELLSILSYWRSSVPLDFEDYQENSLQVSFTTEFIHVLVLRFTYINCLVMIDHHLPPTEQLSVDPGSEAFGILPPSESICVMESRKAIRLIQITPQGSYAYVWILLQPFFAAVTVLLQNVVRNPIAQNAQSDLQIVKPFLRLIEMLANDQRVCSASGESEKIHEFCEELHSRATKAVDFVNTRQTLW
ncbi:hypothetical protein G7046_g2229 [Stylonectria norvegica]|nr:hypothetical protein G7046_g2229 [Stylonectria norvegica]